MIELPYFPNGRYPGDGLAPSYEQRRFSNRVAIIAGIIRAWLTRLTVRQQMEFLAELQSWGVAVDPSIVSDVKLAPSTPPPEVAHTGSRYGARRVRKVARTPGAK